MHCKTTHSLPRPTRLKQTQASIKRAADPALASSTHHESQDGTDGTPPLQVHELPCPVAGRDGESRTNGQNGPSAASPPRQRLQASPAGPERSRRAAHPHGKTKPKQPRATWLGPCRRAAAAPTAVNPRSNRGYQPGEFGPVAGAIG